MPAGADPQGGIVGPAGVGPQLLVEHPDAGGGNNPEQALVVGRGRVHNGGRGPVADNRQIFAHDMNNNQLAAVGVGVNGENQLALLNEALANAMAMLGDGLDAPLNVPAGQGLIMPEPGAVQENPDEGLRGHAEWMQQHRLPSVRTIVHGLLRAMNMAPQLGQYLQNYATNGITLVAAQQLVLVLHRVVPFATQADGNAAVEVAGATIYPLVNFAVNVVANPHYVYALDPQWVRFAGPLLGQWIANGGAGPAEMFM